MPIDIGFFTLLIYGFWQGYSRGIISTIINLGIYLFGFVLAFKMAPITTNILEAMFNTTNPTLFLLAFLVNLITIMFIFRTGAKALETAARAVYLGILNKVMGGIVTGGLTIVAYSVLVWFAIKVQFLNDETLRQSQTYSILKPIPSKAKDVVVRMKPFALDVWGTSLNWMDRLENYGIQRTDGKQKTYRPPDDAKTIEEEPAPSPSSSSPPKTSRPVEDDNGIEE